METEYIVKHSAACMPSSCWGTYRRIAVLEVVKGAKPRMISNRAKNVVRVVQTWEKLNCGKTSLCAFDRALLHAKEVAAKLQGELTDKIRIVA